MVYDVIVIGGGQAGLSISYYLKKVQSHFLILDEQQTTGDSWRNRYDSLILFTPRSYSSLPGLQLNGDPKGYPTKDEVAEYMGVYAEHYKLPIMHQAKVNRLHKEGKTFIIQTNKGGSYRAKQVVVATGAFHTPYIPPVTHSMSHEVLQMHAVDYRNPNQVPSGKVLIVGAGNTGVQIAAELCKTHSVVLSCSKKVKALPQNLFGKSLFWWLDLFGLLNVNVHTKLGKWIKRNDPIIGSDLKIVRRKAFIVDRLIDFKNKTAIFADQSQLNIPTVIWSTGYRNNYKWIEIPGILDQSGLPIHLRGVSNVEGLYFIGLSWQHKRGSALIHGVGEDAKYLVKQIKKSPSPDVS